MCLQKCNYYAYVQDCNAISHNNPTAAIATKQKTLLTTHILSQVIVLCLAVSHFVLVVFAEDVLVNYVLAKIIRPMWKKTGLTTNEEKFLAVDRELATEMWPPVATELPIKLNASVTELRAPLDTSEIRMRATGGPVSSLASHEMADQAL
jgi:hypothetical protein